MCERRLALTRQNTIDKGKGKLAFLFPGGDAWTVGMGHDVFRNFASARAVYAEADEAAGLALSRMCFEGPETELRQQANVQPAVVVTTLAVLRAAEEAGLGVGRCGAEVLVGEGGGDAAAGGFFEEALADEEGLIDVLDGVLAFVDANADGLEADRGAAAIDDGLQEAPIGLIEALIVDVEVFEGLSGDIGVDGG